MARGLAGKERQERITMITNHLSHTRKTLPHERPETIPKLTADDFCKAKYSHKDQRCYTARMLDVFLDEEKPYIAAYKEFRLATMDYLYAHFGDDHAVNAEQRAEVWNSVAVQLGYSFTKTGD